MKPLFDYLSASRAEVAKVTWPSRGQAIRMSLMVIAFTIVFAAVLAGLDYLFGLGVQQII